MRTPASQVAMLRSAAGHAVVGDEGASSLSGRPVADGVTGRLRWELRATWLAGVRILDRLDRGGYDVFQARPAIAGTDALPLAWRLLTWRRV